MLGKRAESRLAQVEIARSGNGKRHFIELHRVVKSFASAAGTFTALKSVDLRVDKGEFVAVIGKSGSGKSTLTNMISGIDRPTSGQVYVGDTAVHTLNEGQVAPWRGKTLGIVFQFFQLLPTLSLLDNVMLPMDFTNSFPTRERSRRAMELLDKVGMRAHAHKLPSAISGGQQQRVAIARALANDPPIVIADEPTGNLDSKTADSVFDLFGDLVRQGKTILMVTHDNDLAERATRAITIADGEIIEESLARTFPALTEEQLVAATHHIEPRAFGPGSVILRQGDPVTTFHLVVQGSVDVFLPDRTGNERIVATLGRGQYFGEIELLRGGPSRATVRASANSPVEVLELDQATFEELVGQSRPTNSQLVQIAEQRIAENAAQGQGAI